MHYIRYIWRLKNFIKDFLSSYNDDWFDRFPNKEMEILDRLREGKWKVRQALKMKMDMDYC